MSFWDKVTGGAPAPARPQAPVYPQQPWFRPEIQQPAPPAYVPPEMGQQYQPPVEDAQIEAARRKAPSSRSTLTCPNCFGSNIGKPSPNVMEQCFECGWNPRFEQMAAGVSSSGGEGPAHPSRQVSTANNFNPQTIVAKVGG